MMTHAGEPLKVDTTNLLRNAAQIESHASEQQTLLGAAHTQAASVALGSGTASAVIPGMLAAWETTSARFNERAATHAHGHRLAAAAYASTDAEGAATIDDAS